MFLEQWDAVRNSSDDLSKYRPTLSVPSDGYVQPYCDSPLDDEYLGENVYLNMINGAKRYVYITTPYLIVDSEMKTALCLAAKRGVDVQIITPGIPDKKIVWDLTRSYYPELLSAGVHIYEYTPGFIHSKLCICDDEAAVTGTINFDYRSLYLHFENACLFIYNAVVLQAKMTFCVRRKNPRRSSLKIWGISKSIEVCSAVSITPSCGYLHRFCKKKSLGTLKQKMSIFICEAIFSSTD